MLYFNNQKVIKKKKNGVLDKKNSASQFPYQELAIKGHLPFYLDYKSVFLCQMDIEFLF